LAGGKFVLDAGNEGDEAEHDGGYWANFLL
jgi:hypothetical protein